MRLLERAAGVLEEMSPLGYVIAGGALALALAPSAGKTIRRAVVVTTRGILALTSTAAAVTEGAVNTIQDELGEIVYEARTELEAMAENDNVSNMNEQQNSETLQKTEVLSKPSRPRPTKKKQ